MLLSHMDITIDEKHNLIVLRYVGDLDSESHQQNFVERLREEYDGFRFDMLIDLSGLDRSFGEQERYNLAKQWHDYAKGRDIGRRTAVVGIDPPERLPVTDLTVVFPHRIVAVLETYDDGLDWLLSPFTDSDDQGVQYV